MAIVKSDQLKNEESVPKVLNLARDTDAKVRACVFTFTAKGEPINSTIRLGILQRGWRLLGMRMSGPLNFGQAGCVLRLGIPGNTTKYMFLGNGVCDVAFAYDANNTDALFHGEVLAADTELIATVLVAGLGTNKQMRVFVQYVR